MVTRLLPPPERTGIEGMAPGLANSSPRACGATPFQWKGIWILRPKKKPAGAGFFKSADERRSGSGNGLDVRGEAALVAGGLVAVDQATAGGAVEHRLGGLVGGFRAGLVLGFDGLQHLADRRAQHRALAGVAHAAHFGLAGALLGGLDVGHGVTPEQSGEMKPASIAESGVSVNPQGSREQGV